MHIYFLSGLQCKWLVNPSNKRLKLKSLHTNLSLVDTKPRNTIRLIKVIGSVCPERRPVCQSNVDVSAVTNAGNSFSFPLEAGGRINLTVERVIGQNCAACSCQSVSEELSISDPSHNAAHLLKLPGVKIIDTYDKESQCNYTNLLKTPNPPLCERTVGIVLSRHTLSPISGWKNIFRYLCSRGGHGKRKTNSVGFLSPKPSWKQTIATQVLF